MPFYPEDTPAYIRGQRRREADRAISAIDFPIGSEVEIATPHADPVLALHEPLGIVVGVSSTEPRSYTVMCSLRSGREAPLVYPPSALRRSA